MITFERMEWRENIAATQHWIWAHWMKYLFACSQQNDDGTVTIPADKVERWKRQIQTSYDDLTEEEKQSDRQMALRVVTGLSNKPPSEEWRGEVVGGWKLIWRARKRGVEAE